MCGLWLRHQRCSSFWVLPPTADQCICVKTCVIQLRLGLRISGTNESFSLTYCTSIKHAWLARSLRREDDDVDVVKTESISNDGDGSFLRSATLPKPSRLSAPPPPPSLELDTRQYNLYRRNVTDSVLLSRQLWYTSRLLWFHGLFCYLSSLWLIKNRYVNYTL